MNTSYNIVPVTVDKQIVSFRIMVIDVVLFTSVTIMVQLFGSDSQLVDVKNFKIEGEEYASWNQDDNYIITLVTSKLGFSVLTDSP